MIFVQHIFISQYFVILAVEDAIYWNWELLIRHIVLDAVMGNLPLTHDANSDIGWATFTLAFVHVVKDPNNIVLWFIQTRR